MITVSEHLLKESLTLLLAWKCQGILASSINVDKDDSHDAPFHSCETVHQSPRRITKARIIVEEQRLHTVVAWYARHIVSTWHSDHRRFPNTKMRLDALRVNSWKWLSQRRLFAKITPSIFKLRAVGKATPASSMNERSCREDFVTISITAYRGDHLMMLFSSTCRASSDPRSSRTWSSEVLYRWRISPYGWF